MSELLKAWLNALRSGEYAQTTGVLRNDEGYCCLGVLCDISPTSFGEWDEDGTQEWMYRLSVPYGGGENTFIPNNIREHMGLSSNFCQELTALNDERGFSFHQIADYIEESIKDGSAFK